MRLLYLLVEWIRKPWARQIEDLEQRQPVVEGWQWAADTRKWEENESRHWRDHA